MSGRGRNDLFSRIAADVERQDRQQLSARIRTPATRTPHSNPAALSAAFNEPSAGHVALRTKTTRQYDDAVERRPPDWLDRDEMRSFFGPGFEEIVTLPRREPRTFDEFLWVAAHNSYITKPPVPPLTRLVSYSEAYSVWSRRRNLHNPNCDTAAIFRREKAASFYVCDASSSKRICSQDPPIRLVVPWNVDEFYPTYWSTVDADDDTDSAYVMQRFACDCFDLYVDVCRHVSRRMPPSITCMVLSEFAGAKLKLRCSMHALSPVDLRKWVSITNSVRASHFGPGAFDIIIDREFMEGRSISMLPTSEVESAHVYSFNEHGVHHVGSALQTGYLNDCLKSTIIVQSGLTYRQPGTHFPPVPRGVWASASAPIHTPIAPTPSQPDAAEQPATAARTTAQSYVNFRTFIRCNHPMPARQLHRFEDIRQYGDQPVSSGSFVDVNDFDAAIRLYASRGLAHSVVQCDASVCVRCSVPFTLFVNCVHRRVLWRLNYSPSEPRCLSADYMLSWAAAVCAATPGPMHIEHETLECHGGWDCPWQPFIDDVREDLSFLCTGTPQQPSATSVAPPQSVSDAAQDIVSGIGAEIRDLSRVLVYGIAPGDDETRQRVQSQLRERMDILESMRVRTSPRQAFSTVSVVPSPAAAQPAYLAMIVKHLTSQCTSHVVPCPDCIVDDPEFIDL